MKKFFRGASFYLLIFIIIISVVQLFGTQTQEVKDIPFSEFYQSLKVEDIKEVKFVDRRITGTIKSTDEAFTSYLPYGVDTQSISGEILRQAEAGELVAGGEPIPQTPWLIEILPSVFMILIFVVFWFVFMQQSQGGGNKVMNFGKSKAKLHKGDEKVKVNFKHVAGLDEEKEELEEIVDFLKNPKKYIDLGARIPKGILMVGSPGTGKTYLSKAVAGEAGVPFFSISGSDFVEMFVGVGASRVRDLFEQAKKSAPCIIFIDEIDAVGRKRGAGLGGGHDEREQTLNQLLVEMDGFGINEGVIIMAATNRPDILDPALLRPGRFDRQIMVGSPDARGREEILRVHSRNKPLEDDVNLKVLARRTPGFTPADIENLMNEAALLTARVNKKKITMDIIEEAITKVIAGIPKKSKVISEKERKLTAYHEGGHAVVATLLPHTDPVHQVTIIPRGRAGGFTMILPTEDKYYATKTEMEEQLIHLLGGRVAEKLVLDDISTGAQNDLERVSQIARAMVTKYAMSEKLGSMTFGDSSDEVFLGRDLATRRNYSEEVASEIDREIRRLVDEAYEMTEKLLSENIDKLHNVANALLKYETLDAQQYVKAFAGELDLTIDPLEDIPAETETHPEESDTVINKEETEDEKNKKLNVDFEEN